MDLFGGGPVNLFSLGGGVAFSDIHSTTIRYILYCYYISTSPHQQIQMVETTSHVWRFCIVATMLASSATGIYTAHPSCTSGCGVDHTGVYGMTVAAGQCTQCQWACGSVAPNGTMMAPAAMGAPFVQTTYQFGGVCGTATYQTSPTGCGFMWLSPCTATSNVLGYHYCQPLACSAATPTPPPTETPTAAPTAAPVASANCILGTNFTACSTLCGGGTRTRSGDTSAIGAGTPCPSTTESCNTHSCNCPEVRNHYRTQCCGVASPPASISIPPAGGVGSTHSYSCGELYSLYDTGGCVSSCPT